MRTRFGWIASVLAMFVIGCNTVDPDECWVNTSGGFGGGGTIPIGAGVGATGSGDFLVPPPGGPLAADGTPNPCVAIDPITIPLASPSDFPFVTTVNDSGAGKAGGWQVAKANLPFYKIQFLGYTKWYCDFVVEMPLRSELKGKIPATLAATMSADVANSVAKGMDYTLPQGIFCIEFVKAVDASFNANYKGFGASATKK